MVIFWKIPYVDKTQKERSTILQGNEKVEHTHYKRCARELYINTDELSKKEQIFVDIALKAQNLLGDISCFIFLKDLFKEGKGYSISNVFDFYTVKDADYFENAEGKQISPNQYMEELLGLPPMVRLHNNLHVPVEFSEQAAREQNFQELVPFDKKDFQLPEQHIDTLNRFVNGVIELQNSSLCTQYHALTLTKTGESFSLKQDISEEQYRASLLAFRKLYMHKEPANFKNTVKILRNKQYINHPIIEIINLKNEEYENILNQKLCEHHLHQYFFENTLDQSICPDGKTLIDVMFNVDCIHQGNDETRKKRNEVEQIISNQDVLKFLVWSLLLRLQEPIGEVAKQALRILEFLDAKNISIPSPSISNAERKFFQYVLMRSADVAEIIWNENNRNCESMLAYRSEALTLILSRLGICKKKYEIFQNENGGF